MGKCASPRGVEHCRTFYITGRDEGGKKAMNSDPEPTLLSRLLIALSQALLADEFYQRVLDD